MFAIVRCNPDVCPPRNRGRVAYFWKAVSVDFRHVYVDHCWSNEAYVNVSIYYKHILYNLIARYVDVMIYDIYIYTYIVLVALCTWPSRMLKMCKNRAIGRFCLKWISIPYEDKLMLFPINILFRGGGGFWFLMNINWCYHPIQHIVQKGLLVLISTEDKLILLPHSTYCSEEVDDFDSLWK